SPIKSTTFPRSICNCWIPQAKSYSRRRWRRRNPRLRRAKAKTLKSGWNCRTWRRPRAWSSTGAADNAPLLEFLHQQSRILLLFRRAFAVAGAPPQLFQDCARALRHAFGIGTVRYLDPFAVIQTLAWTGAAHAAHAPRHLDETRHAFLRQRL